MIIHYLKIAWRNLMKYKVQNTVCIIGLAVGFGGRFCLFRFIHVMDFV